MSFRLTNIAAMSAQRSLYQNNLALAKSIEKLSTGLRINQAADDAAGLAVSERLLTQVNGLKQANKNVQDGISLLQVADGGMNSIADMLQRGRLLAIQAANDVLTDQDRAMIQTEITELLDEVDRQALSTTFNNKQLLSGTVDSATMDQLIANTPGWFEDAESFIEAMVPGLSVGPGFNLEVEWVNSIEGGFAGMAFGNSRIQLSATIFQNLSDAEARRIVTHELTHTLMSNSIAGFANLPSWVVEGTAMWMEGGDGFVEGVRNQVGTAGILQGLANFNYTNQDYAEAYEAMEYIDDLDADGNSVDDFINQLIAGNSLDTAIANTTASTDAADFAADFDGSAAVTADTNAASAGDGDGVGGAPGAGDIPAGAGAQDITVNITNNTVEPLVLQVGANRNDNFTLELPNATRSELGLSTVDVTSRENANQSISSFDDAINKLNEGRAVIGSQQNRLESASAFIGVSIENQAASYSRIREVDISAEIVNMTRLQILIQTGTAALRNANLQSQSVLQLLP